jgi:hypothetical protein
VNRFKFGPKRDEIGEGWRNLHNEELHKSYFWPNEIITINSRRMRWTEHVACTGEKEKKNGYRIWVEKSEGKTLLGDLHVGRWIILKRILER